MQKKLFMLFVAVLVAATTTTSTAQDKKDEHAKKVYPSFLTKNDVADGSKYLPAPPDTASTLFWGDYAQYQWGKAQRATARGEQARIDAEMDCESVLRGFAPAIGITITEAAMPETYKLLNYTESDLCNGTSKAKKHWMRKRPFVQFGEGTLVPEEEESHRNSGSFPSSHSATGWGIALMLVELFPDCQDAILKQGWEFGQSRVIAGYHYQSDVDAARLAAAAVIARLHADEGFQKQLAKAKKEIAKLTVNR